MIYKSMQNLNERYLQNYVLFLDITTFSLESSQILMHEEVLRYEGKQSARKVEFTATSLQHVLNPSDSYHHEDVERISVASRVTQPSKWGKSQWLTKWSRQKVTPSLVQDRYMDMIFNSLKCCSMKEPEGGLRQLIKQLCNINNRRHYIAGSSRFNNPTISYVTLDEKWLQSIKSCFVIVLGEQGQLFKQRLSKLDVTQGF